MPRNRHIGGPLIRNEGRSEYRGHAISSRWEELNLASDSRVRRFSASSASPSPARARHHGRNFTSSFSQSGAEELLKEGAAIDFARDAFEHLKAIAIDRGGQVLLKVAGVVPDAGVIPATKQAAFIAAAKTRQWDREPSVRTLA